MAQRYVDYHFGGMKRTGVDPSAGYWEDVTDSAIADSQFSSMEEARQWALDFVARQADSSQFAMDRIGEHTPRGEDLPAEYDVEQQIRSAMDEAQDELLFGPAIVPSFSEMVA